MNKTNNKSTGFIFCVLAGILLLAGTVYSGGLTITEVKVTDTTGVARGVFSSTERISLLINCNNSVQVTTIDFEFYILDPSGTTVFTQKGNSVVGNIGLCGASLKNISSKYYTKPGTYTFKGKVLVYNAVALIETVEQSSTFLVTSPNITLFYPPNGAQDLVDNPLYFRWVTSGASSYRVYVDINQNFGDPLWTGETSSDSISYPDNPTNPRQKLTGGTTYWWKVSGLNEYGKVIAETSAPFSFTIKPASVSPLPSHDLAVADVGFSDAAGVISKKAALKQGDSVKIAARVENKGGYAETSIPVSLFIDGKSVDSPQKIELISIGEVKTLEYKYIYDSDSTVLTASCLLEYNDDYARNNLLTATLNITPVKEKEAIISGRIVDGQNKGLSDVTVTYAGPDNGSVQTDEGGNYLIHKIALGKYTVTATKAGYASQSLTVTLDSKKAYPQSDLVLFRAAISDADFWNKLQPVIKSVSKDDFNGYHLTNIDVPPDIDPTELIENLKSGKYQITGVAIEVVF